MNSQIKQRIDQIRRGEVPEGYKKTKVGIVPEEWEITKLYLISSHVSKKNTNGEVQTTFTNSATQGVIKQTDYFDKEISNKENITSYYVVQENDYIYNPRISVSAPCGPINKSHFSENGIVSPLYTVFRLNDVFQQNKYIEFFFKSSFWHSYMCGIANYGARHDRMNITNYDLFNMPIPFPPIAEQEKIAEILQTQDKVIELQQKKIDELKRLKKVYLSKMFPKKGCNVPEIRFPGFTDPWEQRKLGELVDRVVRKNTNNESTLPLTISAQYGLVDQITYFNNRVASRDVSNYYLVLNGEFAYNKSTSDGYPFGAVKRLDLYEKGVLSTLYIVFAPKKEQQIDSDYLTVFFDTDRWHKGVAERAAEGARNHGLLNISAEDFFDIDLSVPKDIVEQKQIGAFIRQLDNLITLHQRKCDEEKQKKKALMQLLLTGIVRTNK